MSEIVGVSNKISLVPNSECRPDKPVEDSCIVNCGMVLQIEVDDIPRLLRYTRRLPNSKVIYHTKSLGHLRIVKE